jgi:hypothetical protein
MCRAPEYRSLYRAGCIDGVSIRLILFIYYFFISIFRYFSDTSIGGSILGASEYLSDTYPILVYSTWVKYRCTQEVGNWHGTSELIEHSVRLILFVISSQFSDTSSPIQISMAGIGVYRIRIRYRYGTWVKYRCKEVGNWRVAHMSWLVDHSVSHQIENQERRPDIS